MRALTKISDWASNLFTGRKAYDPTFEPSGYSVSRFYLNRRPLNLNDPAALYDAYAQHPVVYACINKIADVMNDAQLQVVRNVGKGSDAKAEVVEGHPLMALFNMPNPNETGHDFRRLMVQSEYIAGIFYGELVRSGAGMPVEIYALNPNKVIPRVNKGNTAIAYYEYRRSDGEEHRIKPENMVIRRRVDIVNRWYGLSPLAVALKAINSDLALTDYVDAFFASDGTPSGILKFLNATVPDTKREAVQAQWQRRYGRGGTNHKGVAVLDQNVDYQAIGAKLNELDAETISARFETHICSAFGVPAKLVQTQVGLRHTTANATAKSDLRDFWDNKINPELAQLRQWLTWFILPMFEDIEQIKTGKIEVIFDTSNTAFLQEDVDEIHTRVRDNFKAGLMMLNEARESIGLPPDESAKGQDYYIMPTTFVAVTGERRLEEAESEPEPVPAQLPPANGNGAVPVEEDEEQVAIPRKTLLSAPSFPTKDVKELPPPIPEPVEPLVPEVKAKPLIEYDGLMLHREPDHLEKLCDLKSMVNELEINQERAQKALKRFRLELIEQATEKLDRRDPGNANMITLEPDPKIRKDIAKAIRNAYATGQNQVARELMAQNRNKKVDPSHWEVKDLDEDDLEYIDSLADGLVSRMINEIRTRAINQFLAFKLLGNYTKEVLRGMLLDQSEKFIKQLAESSINAATMSGRADEANARKDEWDRVMYSAILDNNTCGPCEEADGMEADDPAELPDAPNPDCEGGINCRCFHVYIAV
jgi:HK97 family phage portal protein